MSDIVIKKRWLQMGAELEGSWPNRAKAAQGVRGAKPHDDKSVHIGHGDPGEIVTRPHEKLEDLLADISALWPESVNDSCGFHIHASFTPLDGSIIASKGFYQYFKEEWNDWGHKIKLPKNHEFWIRLAGQNKHARDRFEPEVQLKGNFAAQGRADARYTMLNFYAWEKHRTIECRMLPMFADKEIALSAVTKLASIYDTYLSLNGFESIVLEPAIQVVGETAEEVYEYTMPVITPRIEEREGILPPLVTGPDICYAIPGAMDAMFPYATDTKKSIP